MSITVSTPPRMDLRNRPRVWWPSSRPSRNISNATSTLHCCCIRECLMANRPLIILVAFAAGAAVTLLMPGGSIRLQRTVGVPPAKTWAQSGSQSQAVGIKAPVIAMDNERIKLAQIEQAKAGSGTIVKRLTVPGTVIPDADRVAHVSVKLSGTVAGLRKKIGDDVAKGEVLAVLESREVADAKSEYLAARLANELQQDLTTRDKSLWE